MHCSSGLQFRSSDVQDFLMIISQISMAIISQVRAGGEALEWNILLFLSFQIFHRENPERIFQIRARIGFLKEIECQLSRVSLVLFLFWFDLHIA